MQLLILPSGFSGKLHPLRSGVNCPWKWRVLIDFQHTSWMWVWWRLKKTTHISPSSAFSHCPDCLPVSLHFFRNTPPSIGPSTHTQKQKQGMQKPQHTLCCFAVALAATLLLAQWLYKDTTSVFSPPALTHTHAKYYACSNTVASLLHGAFSRDV